MFLEETLDSWRTNRLENGYRDSYIFGWLSSGEFIPLVFCEEDKEGILIWPEFNDATRIKYPPGSIADEHLVTDGVEGVIESVENHYSMFRRKRGVMFNSELIVCAEKQVSEKHSGKPEYRVHSTDES
jgi:hypothetical protein